MIKYDVKKIDNKHIRMIPKKMTEPLSNEIDNVVLKMKNRVEKEIPDRGFFRNFAEDYKNNNKNIYAKAISLNIEKDENIEGQALLLVSALHPNMNIDASSMLFCGKRNDILKFMNQKDFKSKLEAEILKLSDSLKQI